MVSLATDYKCKARIVMKGCGEAYTLNHGTDHPATIKGDSYYIKRYTTRYEENNERYHTWKKYK